MENNFLSICRKLADLISRCTPSRWIFDVFLFSVAALAVSIVFLLAVPALADEPQSTLTLGLKTRYDDWTVGRREYSNFQDLGYDPDDKPLELWEADPGVTIGPELIYQRNKLFLRGFYLYGSGNFEDQQSKGTRSYAGADVGYGGNFIFFGGLRSLSVSFSSESAMIIDHSTSDIVLGLSIRPDQSKKGLTADMDLLIGFTYLMNAIGDDEYKGTQIAEARVSVGYTFTRLPVNISLGYSYMMYYSPAGEVMEHSSIAEEFSDFLEKMEDVIHGPEFRISYVFNL